MECYELAKEYYRVATVANVTSAKSLREVYTLIQLAIALLDKIGTDNKILRIKSLLLKCEIIDTFNVDTGDLQPEFMFDECMILLNSLHYNDTIQYFKIVTELKLIQRLNSKGYHKQSLKLANESQFNQLLVYQFLKFTSFNKDDAKALGFIQFLTSNDDLEVSNFFRLTEASLCFKLGMECNVQLIQINTNIIQLQVMKQLLLVLSEINHRDPNSSLDQHLRVFAKMLSDNKQSLKNTSFPLIISGIKLEIPCLDYPKLYAFFVLMFGISSLNYSFEKRKSLNMFDQCMGLIDNELSRFNRFNSHLYSSTISFYKELKKLTLFYTVIEHLITVGISGDVFDRFISDIGDGIESDYLKCIQFQSSGQLEQAKQGYYDIINRVGQVNALDEYYIFSCLNVLLILEGQLSYNARTNKDNCQISSERTQILSRLQFFTSIPHSDINQKYLIQTTLAFISLINNHFNLSTLDINIQVTAILDANFEHIKKFPLLCSLLLYLKSSTLNQNSDQRQKSSQIAFNLSKFGNQIIVRYATGLLNFNNSQIARNLQQSEIQKQKLDKISKTIEEKFSTNIYN